MTSKTKLCIPKGDGEIPTVSPSLMPFHIAYSGPAPISTFFLTKPFVDAGEKRRQEVSTNKEIEPASIGDGGAGDQVPKTSSTRLQAAFRGRKVVSHAVQLPEGYTGLLLTQRGAAKPLTQQETPKARPKSVRMPKTAALKAGERAKALKAKAAAKLKAGGSRRSPRKGAMEVQDEEELEPEEELVQLEEEIGEPVVEKVFEVAGQFQTFTLWNPDVAVDEARDEYIRSVNEWITLAGEIHRI